MYRGRVLYIGVALQLVDGSVSKLVEQTASIVYMTDCNKTL